MNLIQTWYDDTRYGILHFDTGLIDLDLDIKKCNISLIDLDLDSRSQQCEKAKKLRWLSHKDCNRFDWNLVYGRDLLVWWTSYSFLSSIQYSREKTLFMGFSPPPASQRKKKPPPKLDCIQTFTDWSISKFDMVMETTRLYSLILVLMTLTFVQEHRCTREKKKEKITSVSIFSQI